MVSLRPSGRHARKADVGRAAGRGRRGWMSRGAAASLNLNRGGRGGAHGSRRHALFGAVGCAALAAACGANGRGAAASDSLSIRMRDRFLVRSNLTLLCEGSEELREGGGRRWFPPPAHPLHLRQDSLRAHWRHHGHAKHARPPKPLDHARLCAKDRCQT